MTRQARFGTAGDCLEADFGTRDDRIEALGVALARGRREIVAGGVVTPEVGVPQEWHRDRGSISYSNDSLAIVSLLIEGCKAVKVRLHLISGSHYGPLHPAKQGQGRIYDEQRSFAKRHFRSLEPEDRGHLAAGEAPGSSNHVG